VWIVGKRVGVRVGVFQPDDNVRPRFPLTAAFHEAGHAVARLHVGAPPTATWIAPDGRGVSEGTGTRWTSASPGYHAAWDLLLVLLAGPHAEAKQAQRSRAFVMRSSGAQDFAEAKPIVAALVRRGYADDELAAWRRADQDVRRFVQSRWPAVASLAWALACAGRVPAEDLVRLVRRPACGLA
jgi:hypothetical protein